MTAALAGLATNTSAAPAVFFNGDLTVGEQSFISVVNKADAAYNAANPGANYASTVFKLHLDDNPDGKYSVTVGGTTVYVKTTLAGAPATNSGTGDNGTTGFTDWDVGYTSGDWTSAVAGGYTISFFSDSAYATEFKINAVGFNVTNWGTCCATGNVKPDNSLADASQIYMLFNGNPLLVGGIKDTISGTEHFIAGMDDSGEFSSITMVPNGDGEAFGAGGHLIFSLLQLNSVPINSSVVTVGTPPEIQTDQQFTPDDVQNGAVLPVFNGGTLILSGSGSINLDMQIRATGGTIDTNGQDLTINGVMGDAPGESSGSLSKTGDGTLTLSQVNTYTGSTTIAGGTLALTGNGEISSSSRLVNNGTFDISRAFGGATVQTMSGAGSVALGGATLTITNASDTFSGSISGAGGLNIAGGTMTLDGANTFTGGLEIDHAQVRVGSAGALGSGPIILRGGILQATADLSTSNAISVTSTGSILDTTTHDVTLSGDISGPGTLNKYGAGTLTLTGANTQQNLDIRQGSVHVGSAASVGAANADVRLRQDTTFVAGADMTLTQNLHIGGATFDTGLNDVTLSGSVDGDGCLIKAGGGRLNLTGAASNVIGACVQQGTLSFNNVFTGKVWVYENGLASGSGRIDGDVEVDGVLSPGNSPGRLVVAGDVTQSAGSTLAIEIDGRTPGIGAGHHDTLELVGVGSVYTAGGTISTKLRGITGSANNTFTPVIGDTFQVVVAEGGVQGAYSLVTQPTDGMPSNSRLDVIYTPKSVVLAVTPLSYRALFVNAEPRNAASAAATIDEGRLAPGERDDTNSGRFRQGLMGLNTAQISRTMEQASGEIHADKIDAVIQTSRSTRETVSEHLNARHDNARLAGGEYSAQRNVWGAVTSTFGSVDRDVHGQRYQTESMSLVFGVDTTLTESFLVGAAFAYGETKVDTSFLGKAETDSYQGLAYASWTRAGSFVNGVVAAGVDNASVERRVDLFEAARTLSSKSDGASWGADIEAGHSFVLNKVAITPTLGLAYDRIEHDALTEKGDAFVALNIDETERNALLGRVGMRVSTSAPVGNLMLSPYGSVSVTQELSDKATELTAALNGRRFDVTAPSSGRTAVRAGAGLGVRLSPNANVRLGYRVTAFENTTTNAVDADFSIRW